MKHGASLADLLRDLQATGHDRHASTKILHRMAALFRTDQEAAREAAHAILGGLDEEVGKAVVGALGSAGTPEAQRMLGEVLSADKVDATLRQYAAITLGHTKQPTRETVALLAKTSRGSGPLADAALLALGRTASTSANTASATIEELLHRLASAATDDARVRLLRALGNTADPRILIALEAALASRSSAVRATAVEAMRLLPAARVDALLGHAMRDPSADVRTAAVLAATGRPDIAPLLAALLRPR